MLNFESGGEVPGNNCCDVCDNKASIILREEKSIIDFFNKNKRRFTKTEAASVLTENKMINWSDEDAKQTINYLLKTGKLKKIKYFPWKNKIR
jgi:hypothetical protein